MGIILGLLAAVGWGTADFLARAATKQVGTYRTLFFMQVIGGIGMTALVLGRGELARVTAHVTWHDWLWLLLAAGLNMSGTLALYRSFEIGVLSLVSPIAASYAVITVLLAVLGGDHLRAGQSVGIAAAIVGVVLASVSAMPSQAQHPVSKWRLPRGVGFALLAALGFGVTFWIFGTQVAPHFGGIVPVWTTRLTATVLLGLLATPTRNSLALPALRTGVVIAGVALLDTSAFVGIVAATTLGNVAVVNVLASLFSAVTVLLASVFLRERLRMSQWGGIALIFLGIVLVSR